MREYDLYYKRIIIGEYQELDNGELRIVLNENCNYETNFAFFGLRPLQKDGVLDTEGVKFWFNSRVTPYTQDGIERKLKAWGLKNYNMMNILYRSDCINISDHFWINFSGISTYDKNHPRGDNFERIIGMPLEMIKQ